MASLRQSRFSNPSWLLRARSPLCSQRRFPQFPASLRRGALATAHGLMVLGDPETAFGFERQWHVGAGGGVVMPSREYGGGPGAALHAAYGLSDMFDARLELRSSVHEGDGVSERNTLSQLALGLAYKVDIIEWVPYLGVRAGFYRFGVHPKQHRPAAPPELEDPGYARHGGMVGAVLGMDYAFSRSAAVGAEIAYDSLFPNGGAFGAFLHFEYRWGF